MKEETAAAIARLVRDRRIERNLTQQQLADLTGLSLRSVQRLEKAETISRSYTLETIGKHLDIEERLKEINTRFADGETVAPDLTVTRSLSHAQKMILSIGIGLLMALLIMAYVFQSPAFPETGFEMILLIAGALIVYTGILVFIWR